MPLVVPALRLCYVLLNVYETFKTVKLPPPSARNGGQPSARAMTQRKRSMKGCMAVWMVWCCFTLYERFVDGVIRIFIPFYDELKSLVLVFLLVTRARGAEPIYLHCLRPIIKPHAATLDAALNFGTSIGDLVLLVAAIPYEFMHRLYRQWFPGQGQPVPGLAGTASAAANPARPSITDESRFASTRSVQSVLSTDSGYASGTYPADTLNSKSAKASSYMPAHQVWLPPQSAYDDSDGPRFSRLPTPPADCPPPPPYSTTASHTADAEWRQYPAFPSAYPPTPMPAPGHIAGDVSMPVPMKPAMYPQFSGISEGGEEPDFVPPRPEALSQQGFRMSLRSPRESSNPDSDGGLSDDSDMLGIQPDRDVDMAGASEDGSDMEVEDGLEEEDSFDITLRTPAVRKLRKEEAPRNKLEAPRKRLDAPTQRLEVPMIMLPSVSTDSRVSRSTTLSTSDNGSSLRTRTNSEVSSAPSDSSSMAGRKRRVQAAEEEDPKPRNTLAVKPSSKLPTRSASRRVARVARPMRTTSESSAGDENAALSGDVPLVSTVAHKKRKVSVPKAPSQGRPARNPTASNIQPAAAKTTRLSKSKVMRPAVSSQPMTRASSAAAQTATSVPSGPFIGVEVAEASSGVVDDNKLPAVAGDA